MQQQAALQGHSTQPQSLSNATEGLVRNQPLHALPGLAHCYDGASEIGLEMLNVLLRLVPIHLSSSEICNDYTAVICTVPRRQDT